MQTLLNCAGVSQILHWSPALPYRSPNVPNKMDFWTFLCFSLKFSLFFPKSPTFFNHCTVSGAFLHVFSHYQRWFCQLQWWMRILIVFAWYKTLYNVLTHFHVIIWWLGQFVGRGSALTFGHSRGSVKEILNFSGWHRLALIFSFSLQFFVVFGFYLPSLSLGKHMENLMVM